MEILSLTILISLYRQDYIQTGVIHYLNKITFSKKYPLIGASQSKHHETKKPDFIHQSFIQRIISQF